MDRIHCRRFWPWSVLRRIDGDVQNCNAHAKPPQMYLTVAVLQGDGAKRIQFTSAAHPPLLHYRCASHRVDEYPPADPPLGLLDGQQFSESTIESSSGDVFLILTDGLSEVFDRHGKELGIEPIKSVFDQNAERPLS